MNVNNSAMRAAVIERYKSEIVQFMVLNPVLSKKQGTPDSVNITDFGKLLYELSRAGDSDSRQIIANVIAGRPDERLDHFVQAYCWIYGYDFSDHVAYYDRYGNCSYSEYYVALKNYLSTFDDYMADLPSDDEIPGGLFTLIKKYLKNFLKFLAS